MIVIATNNGWDYIDKNVEAIIRFNIKDKVLIVDTNSSDEEYTKYVENLCNKNNFLFGKLGYNGYDFGAYLYAYETYPDEEYYIFQHDSVVIKTPVSYDMLIANTTNNSICAWMGFGYNTVTFDNNIQKEWCNKNFGSVFYNMGIFGPNFSIRKETLDKIYDKVKDVKVTNKLEQQGMERGWAIVFTLYGIEINYLEKAYQLHIRLDADDFTFFTKLKHKKSPRK